MEKKEISFTEDEVNKLNGFLNFIANKAKFDINLKESTELAKSYVFMAQLSKKIEDHIFEVKRVINPKKEK